MEYYSVIKNEVTPFAAIWMDIEIIILNEVSLERGRQIWYHLYVKIKCDTSKVIYKTETDS